MGRFSIGCLTLASFFFSNPSNAAEFICENMLGYCKISNNNGDHFFCSCGDDGDSGGSTGDNEWDGLDADALAEICHEELESSCSSVDSDDDTSDSEDSVGTSTSTGTDTGTDDTGVETDSDTGSDSNSVVCENEFGTCEYTQNGSHHNASCECVDGSGGVTGSEGGDEESDSTEDTGVSEEELLEACHNYLDVCGPSDPPPADGVQCKNEFGFCTVTNENHDFVSCECSNGSGHGGTGGNDWEDLSQSKLLEICYENLVECQDEEDTSDGDETTDTGDATTSTGTSTTGDGEPPDSDADTSDSENDSDEGNGESSDTGSVDPHDLFDCRIDSSTDWKLQIIAGIGLLGLGWMRKRKHRIQ